MEAKFFVSQKHGLLIALERDTGTIQAVPFMFTLLFLNNHQDLLPLYPCDCLTSEFHSPPMGLGERLTSNARGVVLPILGTML